MGQIQKRMGYRLKVLKQKTKTKQNGYYQMKVKLLGETD